MSDVKTKLKEVLHDPELIRYFYLDLEDCKAFGKALSSIRLKEIGNMRIVPFNAQLRNYTGAVDEEGDHWLVKVVEDPDEIIAHKTEQVAYMLDTMMATLAAPTILLKQDGVFYRATKVVKNAMQIGSYNYMEEPFKRVLTNDLINRWLFFDEDRNPNNYLVLHNSKNTPMVVAIDYNKVDLQTREMKIKGDDEKFGWHREEKTRFLTLLKPSNFEHLNLQNFERRLEAMMDVPEESIRCICSQVFAEDVPNPQKLTDLITVNVLRRREYINEYFRRFFTYEEVSYQDQQDDRYAGLGQSFLDHYKKKL